jgi:hypothetical protein
MYGFREDIRHYFWGTVGHVALVLVFLFLGITFPIVAVWYAYTVLALSELSYALLWQVPHFLLSMVGFLGLSIVGLYLWAMIFWYFLGPAGLLLVGKASAGVLMQISRALVHKWLSPIIRISIAIILVVGLFLDLLSS